MSKARHRDYAPAHRDRYKKRFEQAYGMPHKEWPKFKKTHSKAEVHERRMRARERMVQ